MRYKTSRVVPVQSRTSISPLAEGLAPKKPEGIIRGGFWCITLQGKEWKIPLDGHGNRNWAKLSNDEILAYARAYCNENKITTISELTIGEKVDSGLHRILAKRRIDEKRLIDIIFERKQFEEVCLDGKMFRIPLDRKQARNWQAMTNDEIVVYAKAYCKEKGITKPVELGKGNKSDAGLYFILDTRKIAGKNLLDMVFERKDFEEVTLQGRIFKIPLNKKQQRNWAKISDSEILEFAKAYCKDKEMAKSIELLKGPNSNKRLYFQLNKRKLLDHLFERKQFKEVVLDGKTFMIPLDKKRDRNWKAMSDADLVAYARAYCNEKRIKKPVELQKGQNKDQGLCAQLQKRKVLDQIFERKDFDEIVIDGMTFIIPLDKKQKRNWTKMSDDEIVAYAKAYCNEKGIINSNQLQLGSNRDSGLWNILNGRNLSNLVFNPIKDVRKIEALTELATALESFRGSGK